ncbi:MAG: M42 family peptidase, partial [Candidatus Aphodomorpha sp.]
MDYMETLSALTSAAGTSGNEGGAAAVAEGLFRQYTEDVWRDPLGNVYARIGSGRPVVLVCAHMDEIGMMVASIEDNGMLRMARVGGIDPRVLPGSEVVVHGKTALPGVIGAVPPHLLGADRDAAYQLEELTCDTGY